MICYVAYSRVKLLGVILMFIFSTLLGTLGTEFFMYSEYLGMLNGALWWVLVIVYMVVLLVLILNSFVIAVALYVFFFSGLWALMGGTSGSDIGAIC